MVKLNECLCDYSNQFSFLPPFPTVFCVTVFFFFAIVFFSFILSHHTHTTLPSVCLHPPCAIYSSPSIFLIPFNTSSSPPSRFASHPPFIFLFLPFPPSNFFSPYLLFSFFCLICFHELMNPLFFFPLSYLSFTHSLLFLPSPIPPSLFLRQSVSFPPLGPFLHLSPGCHSALLPVGLPGHPAEGLGLHRLLHLHITPAGNTSILTAAQLRYTRTCWLHLEVLLKSGFKEFHSKLTASDNESPTQLIACWHAHDTD